MESTIRDRKPGKALAVYIPLALGLVTSVFIEPMCECSWPELLLIKAAAIVAGFVFWWLVLIASYHTYHFLKSLFHHPR